MLDAAPNLSISPEKVCNVKASAKSREVGI